MGSCLAAWRVTINERELTILRHTRGRAGPFRAIALPEQLFDSSQICRFPIKIGPSSFIGNANNAFPIRHPNWEALNVRIECEPRWKLSGDIVYPDVAIFRSSSPKRIRKLRAVRRELDVGNLTRIPERL